MTIAQTLEVRVARAPAEVFDQLDRRRALARMAGRERDRAGRASAEPAGRPLSAGSPLRIEQTRRRSVGDRSMRRSRRSRPPARFAVAGRDLGWHHRGDRRGADAGGWVGDDPALDVRIGLPLSYRMFESMAAPQVQRAAGLDLEAFRSDWNDPSPDPRP